MSLTLNMVGGGGGGGMSAYDAILRVQTTANSTVTISKDGTTKTAAGHENASDATKYDYYFVIKQDQFDSNNPWTVTATIGSLSSSDTVIIDSPDEYNVALTPLVPSTYQAVEYLYASGSQIIDLNFYPTGTTEFEVTFLTNNTLTKTGSYGAIFGGRTNYYTNGYCYTTYTESASSKRGHMLYGSSSSSSVNNIRYDGRIVKDVKMTSEFHNGSLSSTGFSGSTSISSQTFTSTGTLALFGLNEAGTYSEKMTGYIYSAKFWSNSSTLIRDMWPCYRRSDSVAGMYDRVNDVFYPNVGSGTFTVGADVK